MSRNLKRFLSAILVALLVVAALPAAAVAESVGANIQEAKKLATLDNAWAKIEKVEDEALARKASPAEVTMAAYKAALNSGYVDEGSMVWESDKQFAFTVDGMHCLYYYTARNAQKNVKPGDGETIVTSYSKAGNCAGSQNVLLVGPYYSSDSSFTDQYQNEADSIGEATGGTVTKLINANATGPAIAAAYTDKGVVIYDSHGTQSGTSSYLCLTTNTGITSTDYNNGWAVSSGSAAYIDGRYIQNHVSGALSNPIVWMAICEGMKASGNGTTGTALLAAGCAAVYGYSQSVTFKGDYEYEETFWNEMKNGATMADALVVMKNQYGVPDPYGDAYPIVMSPVDPFPSNPDAAQTVNCDWTLFSQDPVALESFAITNSEGTAVTNTAVAMGKKVTVKVLPTPSNANNYSVAWSTSNAGVATVTPSTNGKSCVITGVTPGTAVVTATVTTESKAVQTKTIAVNVTEAAQWVPVDTIVPGDPYLIGFVAGGNTYLAVNYNVSASNHYYYSSSSNYLGYTAPATMNGQNVIGVSGNADDLEYCTFYFSSATGGTIQSAYQSSYYLRTWTNTSYTDCYVDTTSQDWTYSNHTLYRTISSTNRYAQYTTVSGGNYMCVGNSVPSGYSVQLYTEQAVVTPTEVPTDEPITAPAVTYTGETVTVENPAVNDTFYWKMGVSENSGMFSGHWLVDYNENYLTPVGYSVTWAGSLLNTLDTSVSDTPAFVCNADYETDGNHYTNVGMYLTTFNHMGLQAGGDFIRVQYKWTAVPAASTTLPMNITVLESKYMTGTAGNYNAASHEDITVNNGAIVVTISAAPTAEPTVAPTATPEPTVAPTEVPSDPHPVTYYGAQVEQVDPQVNDTFYWTLGVEAGSGMFSGQWLIDYPEEWFAPSAYSVTWSGGLQSIITASWDDDEPTSDKPAFVCNPNYEGQTGGKPVGEAGNMYANCGMYLQSFQFLGLQAGGDMIRLTMKWANVPTESMTIPVPFEVLESTYAVESDNGYTWAPHNVINSTPGAVNVVISPAEPHTVTYYGAQVEQVDPQVNDTFYWTLSVEAGSGMFSGQWLVDYPEEWFAPSAYSVTWSGGLQSIITASWDDDEPTSDKPAFVCNPNYEGQTGGKPVGEAGNMYANCGMYLQSFQFLGLQAGGDMIRLTMKWVNVPTESMTIPVPFEVLESTYAVESDNGYTWAPHEVVNTTPGEVNVVITPAQDDFVWGDANCDGECSWADVSAIYSMLNGGAPLSEQGMINANVGGTNPFEDPYTGAGANEDVDFADISYISSFLTGSLQADQF